VCNDAGYRKLPRLIIAFAVVLSMTRPIMTYAWDL
jgi:hypothetical protein